MIALAAVEHVTALGYAIAVGIPLAGPLAALAYWLWKGCPHVDD